jgi:hypothetical protein
MLHDDGIPMEALHYLNAGWQAPSLNPAVELLTVQGLNEFMTDETHSVHVDKELLYGIREVFMHQMNA